MTETQTKLVPTEPFTITANATARDIAEGKARKCEDCPAARAILRKLRKFGFEWVVVTVSGTVFTGTGIRQQDPRDVFSSEYNPRLRYFVSRVDREFTQPPPPTTFKLHFQRIVAPSKVQLSRLKVFT